MEGIILSSWDHIMGPQIEKLWLIQKDCVQKVHMVSDKILHDFNLTKNCKYVCSQDINLSTMKIYTMMCGQLLLGEVDSFRTVDEWSSRLYVSEDNILLAVLFHVNSWNCSSSSQNIKDACLCFGAVFSNENYELIMHNHLLIDQHLRKALKSLKNSQFSIDLCMKDVTAVFEDVTELIEAIKKFQFKNNLVQNESFLGTNLNDSIITQATVSHLQTSGCTMIVGSSNFHINEIIHLLSLFNMKKLYCDICNQFSKSYIIRTCISPSTQDIEKSSKFLIEKDIQEALTIIDLDSSKVWQTCQEKTDLVNESGHLIPELFNDLRFIEKNKGNADSCLEDFKEELIIRSCTLIKTIEQLRCLGKFPSKKEMMNMLFIKNAVDFDILLGYAENIKPGIRSSIIEY